MESQLLTRKKSSPLVMIPFPLQTSLIFLKIISWRRVLRALLLECPNVCTINPLPIATDVMRFIEDCKSWFPKIQIHTYDERFTSKIASHEISRASTKKQVREDKQLIDQVSATLLLQSFLMNQQTKTS